MADVLRGKSQRENEERTMETVTVRASRAGDPNTDIFVELPPEAMELAYEHAAHEFVTALGEMDRVASDKQARALNVDELFDIQSQLDRARTAIDVLFKARPAEEWEETAGDEGA